MNSSAGTLRATKTNKDKHAKSSVNYNQPPPAVSSKVEKNVLKNQATIEQMRMAQMIDSGKDTANRDTVKQLCEMTGRSEEDVVVALHDAQDDPDRAVLILLEGEQGQGEWEVQDKKKKRSSAKSEKETGGAIQDDRGDNRSDRSRDRHDFDRSDAPPRRGGRDRRNGGPPPRLANRGRGRDRNKFVDRDRERGGYSDRNNYNDHGRDVEAVNGDDSFVGETGTGNDYNDQQNMKDYRDQRRNDRDRGGFGSDRDRGSFGERDRDRSGFSGDRGRGFGGSRGRGRGRGGGGYGRSGSRGGRARRFERQNDSSDGPQIDTWTNETAENAEKETTWNEHWPEATEDCFEDQWTGSLEDTKVFTASQNKSGETDMRNNLNEPTSTVRQRVDVGSLFSKSAEFPKAPAFTKTSEGTSGDSFFSTLNQQAAESIKNSIGIGSASRHGGLVMPSPQPQPLGQLPAMPQREMNQPSRSSASVLPQSTSTVPTAIHPASTSSVPPSMLPSASAVAPAPQPNAQHSQPQRRQQRSKLPPPSKIPASAVEMPGHAMPQLDVQFGVEFGADSTQFGFSTSGDSNSFSNALSTTSQMGPIKSQGEASRQGNILSSPPAGSNQQQSMPSLDASPSRPSVYPEGVYSSPAKSESSANKVAENIQYHSSASDHKSGNLMSVQRTTPTTSSLSQGTLSTSKTPPSSVGKFSMGTEPVPGLYNSHAAHSQAHKSVSSPAQSYRQTGSISQTSVASFPNQYSSQTQYSGAGGQQNQYPSAGQSQFPGPQGQFPSAGSGAPSAPAPNQYLPSQSQYPSGSQGSFPPVPVVTQSQFQADGGQYHGNYQSSSVSFQSQPSAQSGQNPLYPNTTQQSGGSYPSASGSFHVRDSQSTGNIQPSVVNLQQPAGNLQQSVGGISQSAVSQPNSSYQNQQPAQGLSKTTTAQTTSAFNTQTFSAQHVGQHAQPSTTQSPNTYNSQSFTGQHSNIHAQATTSQSPNSYNSSQAYSSQNAQTTTTQNQSSFNTQTFSAQHASQQNLQSSPLGNKMADSLSKMSLKDATSQFDNSSAASNLSGNSSGPSISTSTSTVSATATPVVTSSTLNNSRVTQSIPITTKAPPNLPPGVPLMNPHLFMGQAAAASGIPPYFGLQGLQQPLYGYEELQMMQPTRLPLTGNFYDIAAYPGVPSTISAGRDQAAALGTAPFAGNAADNKQMNRVEAQSPSQSNQQQSTHSAPQQTLPFNIHYGYYYPGTMLPSAAGFQYPMFPMPPVTNAAAAAHVPGTTTAAQLPKTYGSHQGFPSKGTGSTADMNTGAFNKSHAQGFDKQGFPAGTPPPFSLPMANASQAGPLGAPAAPYGAPFLPMMPPQAHNQTLLHHAMPQDSGTGSGRGMQQPANQVKSAGAKPYGSYWSN